jgi:hypothetical protein
MAAMSRLNFMEEQELAIQAIAEELVQLEQLVLKGELIAPENALLFDSCIEQAIRIRHVIRKQSASLPLHNWLQKTDKRAATLGKRRRSELVRRA